MDKKKIRLIVLVSIGFIAILLFRHYSMQKKYIYEDVEQFVYEINYSITNSKIEMDSIMKDKEKSYIEAKDIQILRIYHDNLYRNLWGFVKKSKYINSKARDNFREVWDHFHFNEPINEEDIRLYYDQLFKKVESEEQTILSDEDVTMLKEIRKLYNNTRKEINHAIQSF